MFSILICSINEAYLENVKFNIKNTIGCDYEIIVWNNKMEPKSISEVYNILATRAKFPYWCFLHEDVCFQTSNWSDFLIDAFKKNSSLGMIGIAGSKYKSCVPSGWSTGILSYDHCNIYHKDKEGKTQHIFNNPSKSKLEKVVNLDGVFMVIRKEVWRDANFNSELLTGFHLYDIDFSFKVSRIWELAVSFEIDIIHFTQGGDYGNTWVNYTLNWHKKYRNALPVSTFSINGANKIENKIVNNWLYRLSSEKISLKNKLRWIWAAKFYSKPTCWPYVCYFIVKKLFEKNNLYKRTS